MFTLPKTTQVRKNIPKNSFDGYTNTRQKKLMSDKINRITWVNKLSYDTTNLPGEEVEEIQIFEIDLKEKDNIKELISIIQKAIPYHIICIIRFGREYYLSTAAKHKNPVKEDNAVIDYLFESDWLPDTATDFSLMLKNNLDWVFKNFGSQFSAVNGSSKTITEIVRAQKEYDSLKYEIALLKVKIARCRQFNKKVELNLKLKELERRIWKDDKFNERGD